MLNPLASSPPPSPSTDASSSFPSRFAPSHASTSTSSSDPISTRRNQLPSGSSFHSPDRLFPSTSSTSSDAPSGANILLSGHHRVRIPIHRPLLDAEPTSYLMEDVIPLRRGEGGEGSNGHRTGSTHRSLVVASGTFLLVELLRLFYDRLMSSSGSSSSSIILHVHPFVGTFFRSGCLLVFLIKCLAEFSFSGSSSSDSSSSSLSSSSSSSSSLRSPSRFISYSALTQTEPDTEQPLIDTDTDTEDEDVSSNPSNCSSNHFTHQNWLSIPAPTSESEGESEEDGKRKVRFSRMAEVRTLSQDEGEEAFFSRLSYMRYQKEMRMRGQDGAGGAIESLSLIHFLYLSCVVGIIKFFGDFSYSLIGYHEPHDHHPELNRLESDLCRGIFASTLVTLSLLGVAFFPMKSSTDSLSSSKILSVLLSLSSVFLLLLSMLRSASLGSESIILTEKTPTSWSFMAAFIHHHQGSILLAVISAASYTFVIIMMRRTVKYLPSFDIFLFLGCMSFWQMVLLWPGLLLTWSAPVYADGSEVPWLNPRWLISFAVDFFFVGILDYFWIWSLLSSSVLIGSMAEVLRLPISILLTDSISTVSWVGFASSFTSYIFLVICTNWTFLNQPFIVQWDKGSSNETSYQVPADAEEDEDPHEVTRHMLTT